MKNFLLLTIALLGVVLSSWAQTTREVPGTYATIQAAIDASVAGDVINVAAGTYAENLTLNKSLDIRGPNYGIDPNASPSSRVAEAIIVPSVQDLTITGQIIYLQASNVSINGFTLDGDNTLISGGTALNGADINTSRGVRLDPAFNTMNHFSFDKNIVKNLTETGVYLNPNTPSPGPIAQSSFNYIRNNLFSNMRYRAIYAQNEIEVFVDHNTLTNVHTGIVIEKYGQAATGGFIPAVSNNTITLASTGYVRRQMGISINNRYTNAVDFAITDNTISVNATTNTCDAIRITSMTQGAVTTASNNTIIGNANCNTGYFVWNTDSYSNVVIAGGTITGVKDNGILLTDIDPAYNASSYMDGNYVTIDNVSITTETSGTGIKSVWHTTGPGTYTGGPCVMNVQNGTTISGTSAIGAYIDGAKARINFVGSSPVSFNGGLSNYISLVNAAATNPATVIDATAVSFATKTGATATSTENFAIEDKLLHKMDNTALGLVRVKALELFVTTASGTIQRGIELSASGEVVNVAAGTYEELIAIDKPITLNGPNATIAGNGNRNPEAIIQFPTGTASGGVLIYAGSNLTGVTIAGFDLRCQDATIPNYLYLIYTSKINNLTIRNNRMYGSDIPMYILTSFGQDDYRTGLMVEGNYVDCGPNVNNSYNRGIYVQATSGTIQDNQFLNTNTGIQYMPYGHTTPATIQRNTITAGSVGLYHNYQNKGAAQVTWSQNEVSVAPNDRLGLKAQVAGAYTSTMLTFRGMEAKTFGTEGSGAAPQVYFNNNKVNGNIGSSPYYTSTIGYKTVDASATGITTLTGNSFTNLNLGVANTSSVSVAATCNWWGTAVAAEIAAKITGSATYIPYSVSDGGACAGGMPVVVTRAGTFISVHSTIQASINAVTTQNGDVITVAAGTYAENVNITKSITLNGAKAGVDARTRTFTGESILDGTGLPSSTYDGIKIANGVTNVTIDGFEIRNYAGSGSNGDGNAISSYCMSSNTTGSNNITVQNNYIHGLSYNGILVGSENAISESMVVQSNWLIQKNKLSGFGYAGIELTNVGSSQVKDNDIAAPTSLFPDAGDAGVGIEIAARSRSKAVATNNIEVSGNTLTGTFPAGSRAGINLLSRAYTDANANATLSNITVSGNSILGATNVRAAILAVAESRTKPSAINTLAITNNTIDGNLAGIEIQDYINGAGSTATHSGITISGNDIKNNTSVGLHVMSATAATEIAAFDNKFVSNTLFGVKNEGTGTLASTCNWFGTAVASEVAAKIGGNVQFLPFSTSASPMNCLGVGPVVNTTQSTSYMTIQSAITAATAGDVINVYPGNYNETAANSSFNGATYQFGLFFSASKSNITVQGCKADGTPITNTADIAAFITTNATNNFGSAGTFVVGNSITLRGLQFGSNSPIDDKAIEVLGNGFTFDACRITANAPVYIGDYSYNENSTPGDFSDDVSTIQSYTISNCHFAGATSIGGVYIANGTGWTGSNTASVADRSITGCTFDGMTTLAFAGLSPGMGWLLYPTGAATVTGNTFTNAANARYIQSWGVVQAQFPYASYFNGNTFPKRAITTTDGNANNVRGYDASSSFLNLKRIGTVIQPRIDYAQVGDVILVGAGTYPESLSIDKSLTILGPNATTSPNGGSRATEAIIQPHNATAITGNAAGITVVCKGLTFDMVDCVIDGNMFMYQSSKANTNWNFEKTIFKNAPASTNGNWWLNGSSAGLVFSLNDNLFKQNKQSNGISIWIGSPVVVDIQNNVWENNGYTGLNLNYAQGVISGNTFRETRVGSLPYQDYQSGIILESASSANLLISQNTFTNVQNGINLNKGVSGPISISGNTFNSTRRQSIRISNTGLAGGNIANVSVSGNSFLNYAGVLFEINNVRTDNQVLNATCNWFGTAVASEVAAKIGGNVSFLPFNTTISGPCDGFGPVVNTTQSTSYMTIQAAVTAANANDVITVAAGTYVETGQIVISKNLTITGADKATTIIKPSQGTGGSGYMEDNTSWILVNIGVTFNLSNVTLDGAGYLIVNAVLSHGHGTINNNIIKNMQQPISQDGVGVALLGSDMTVSNNTFSGIGREGVWAVFFSNATITGNTYTGKGNGVWLDYAFEVGRNSTATISGNTISGNVGGTSDGSTSAGILITSYYDIAGTPTGATISNNSITGNFHGITVGYDANDVSVVTATNNDLSGNTVAAIFTTVAPVSATCNWFGTAVPAEIASKISGTVTYIPYQVSNGGACTGGPVVVYQTDGTTFVSSHLTIQAAIAAASSGYVISVPAGTYVEAGQILIDKNLSIVGADKATTIIKTNQSTAGSGDGRGWFLVNAGVTFNLSGVTLDGEGYDVAQGIRSLGTTTVNNCNFNRIIFPGYLGMAIALNGNGGSVNNSQFTNIGRIGVISSLNNTVSVTNNTFTGRSIGDHLDYAVVLNGGGTGTITGNTITACKGQTPKPGSWTSSAIMITTGSGAGTTATISGNTINDCTFGVSASGNETNGQPSVTVTENKFTNFTYEYSGAEYDTYAPKAIDAYETTPVTATCNWFGTADYNVILTKVSGAVTYVPYLVTDNITTPVCSGGVWPVHNVTHNLYYQAIQPAITAANTSDVIEVAAGTYNETVAMGSMALTLKGANYGVAGSGSRSAESVVTGGFVLNESANVIIDGFSVTGNNGASSRGILLGNTNVVPGPITLSNNILENWNTCISLAGGATPAWVSAVTVSRNLIRNNTAGIGSTENVAGLTVSNNTFSGNAEGIGLGAGLTGLNITDNTFASSNSSHIAAYAAGLMPSYTTLFSTNTFGNAAAVSATTGADWTTQSIYNTISGGISNAAVGATILVTAGTYNENVTVDRRITLDGAGSGTDGTVISVSSGSAITVTGSGSDVSNRLIIKDVRVTGGASSGIYVTNATSSSFLTFDNVYALSNTDGISFAGTGTVTDAIISNSTLSNNVNNGLRIASACPSFTGLEVTGCTMNGNGYQGFSYNAEGSNNIGTGFTFTNCTFTNNNAGNNSNAHDLSFYGFKGDATLSNVTVNANHSKAYGIVFTAQPLVYQTSGTITLNGVTISGTVGKGALTFQYYNNTDNISLTNVDVSACTAPYGQVAIDQSGTGTFNLGNTSLKTLVLWNAAKVDATLAIFKHITSGTTLDRSTLADCYQIEDQIGHKIDLSTLGLVTVKTNNLFVTTNSYASPYTTSASIQRGIDAAIAGDVVNVAAGTFNDAIDLNKSIKLYGSNYAISPNTGIRQPETILPLTYRVGTIELVEIKGFEFTNPGGGNTIDQYVSGNVVLEKNYFYQAAGLFFANPANISIIDNLCSFSELGNEGIFISGNYNGASGTYADIHDNVFLNSPNTGFNLSSVNGIIHNNTFNNIDYYGVLVANTCNLDIYENHFLNIENPDITVPTWGAGVRFYEGFGSGLTVNIHDNLFAGNYVGISARSAANFTGTNVTIMNNSITGSTTYGLNNMGTGTLNAINNYWGTCPSVSGLATYFPYWSTISGTPGSFVFGGSINNINAEATVSTVCAGSSTTIYATGGSDYLWDHSLGLGSSKVVTPGIDPTIYNVTAKDAHGCAGAFDNVSIGVSPAPVVTITGPTTIPSTTLVTLTASGAATYLWNTDETGYYIKVYPTSATTYSVTGTTETGCSATATHTVTPVTVSAGPNQFICSGNMATLTASVTGAIPEFYSWFDGISVIASGEFENSINVTPGSTKVYTLTVTIGGSTPSTNVTVFVNSKPIANAGPNITIAPAGFGTLVGSASNGTAPYAYSWSGPGVTSSANAGRNLTVNQEGDFSLIVTDAFGCSSINPVVEPGIAHVTVAITGSTVSGNVAYAFNLTNNQMHDVTVSLKQGSTTMYTTTTAATGTGNYQILGVANGTYTVSLSSPKPWGGVTSADIIAMQNHYKTSGAVLLHGIKRLAGDVVDNSSAASVNVLDRNQVNAKRLNPNGVTLATGNWVFTNLADVSSISYPIAYANNAGYSDISITVLNANVTKDFRSLCYGDVDASYTGMKEAEATIVDANEGNGMELSNYPNPFNESTTLRYTMPVEGSALIEVYNLTGTHITTIKDADHSEGTHTFEFKAGSLAPGIYIYTVTVKTSDDIIRQTGKMIITR